MITMSYIERISAGSVDGYELWLEIDRDDFCTLDDDDGLTPKQIQAYREDKWLYVTATVTAVKHGLTLGQATYGMIEYGELPITDEADNLIEIKEITAVDIDNYVGSELAGEAISQADELLRKLAIEKLKELENLKHNSCGSSVSFQEVTDGYYAECPKCDEDLFSFETYKEEN